jgi:hypothetical protein
VSDQAFEEGFEGATQPLRSRPAASLACVVCRRPTETTGIGTSLCEFCAYRLRQEEAARAQAGGPPPAYAYELTKLLDRTDHRREI